MKAKFESKKNNVSIINIKIMNYMNKIIYLT